MIGNEELREVMEELDMSKPAPAQEPLRQYYFIKKARELVKEEEKRVGRKLTSAVSTFGCQMNATTEIPQTA